MRLARVLLLLGLTVSLLGAAVVKAELSQKGDLIASFDGSLRPTKLPRSSLAPVAVRVAADFRAVNGAELPQLRWISVGINRAGLLYDRGLPVCNVGSIQPATERQARAECGGAIVGSGHVELGVHIPAQRPFAARAKLLAFNGPRRHGRKLILAQAYSKDPPGAFVLSFDVKKADGLFGTVLTTSLPKRARKWAYLTHFDLTLKRTYRYRGRKRSYISAACAAPAGFPGAIFPFARASYGFDSGQRLETTISRSCRVLD